MFVFVLILVDRPLSLPQRLEILFDVSDNGRGVGDSTRRSGLANLKARALQYNGTFSVSDAPPGLASSTGKGTLIRWTIPLS